MAAEGERREGIFIILRPFFGLQGVGGKVDFVSLGSHRITVRKELASHECVDWATQVPGTPKEVSCCSLELTPNFEPAGLIPAPLAPR